jgi:hypothetical protein
MDTLSMPTLLHAPAFIGRRTEVFARTDGTLFFYRRPSLLWRFVAMAAMWVAYLAFGVVADESRDALIGLAAWVLLVPSGLLAYSMLASYQRHSGGRAEELTSTCPQLDVRRGVLLDIRRRKLGAIDECTVARRGRDVLLRHPGGVLHVFDGDPGQARQLERQLCSAGCCSTYHGSQRG